MKRHKNNLAVMPGGHREGYAPHGHFVEVCRQTRLALRGDTGIQAIGQRGAHRIG